MKVSIFIDGNNFYFGLKRIYGDSLGKFDFGNFCNLLSGEDEIVDIFYYNAELDKEKNYKKYRAQKDFFSLLRNIPKFNLILCNLVKRYDGGRGDYYYVLKEDDIHLAVDMVKGAYLEKYDKAVIVSGDGDFVPAIDAVREKGLKVLNACFSKNSSNKLKGRCDGLIKLKKGLLDKFLE